MLNFVICEDSPHMLNKISHMFDSIFMKHNLDAEVVFQTTKVNELLKYVEHNKLDVLVLDIKLNNDLNGLDIAQKIRSTNKDCYIIFITGHCEYILLAYKCKTFDYLCKPISMQKLTETVLRLFEDIKSTSTVNKKYIKLDTKNTIISQNEIQYIKRDGMKIVFHTKSRDYEVYSSFAKIQNQLSSQFVRCHKSFIANMDNITKLEPTTNLIYFNSNDKCDIGPKYKNNFMEVFKSYGNVK